MQIGIGLGLTSRRGGGVSIAVGGLQAMTLRDSTAIDPQGGIGASGSGWVAQVVLKGMTDTGGTCDPSKLTLTVTDPGFDASGNATTVTRTISGVKLLRRTYPNNATTLPTTDGTDLTFQISLSDWVYQGSTITAASLATGFYTGSVAGAAGTIANNSTEPYPKPLFSWINPAFESTGATHDLEAVVFHRHGRSGRQVACVKFTGTDGTNSTPTITTASTDLSAKITQGNIPEVWKATLDMANITQGASATVNAVIYPWIGTSFSLAADGWAWPTKNPMTPLNIHCDRTGAYGGGYAYVQVGAVGGTVSADPAAARAAPYPTFPAALAALKVWNNANKSHNDLGGGFVRMMDAAGADVTHTVAATLTTDAGNTYCTIEKDPLATGVVTMTWTTQRQLGDLIKVKNLRFVTTSGVRHLIGPSSSSMTTRFIADGCDFVDGSVAYWQNQFYYNCTISGNFTVAEVINLMGPASILAGCVSGSYDFRNGEKAQVHIGNDLNRAGSGASGIVYAAPDSTGLNHCRIAYNNKYWSVTFGTSTASVMLDGFANVQNLVETDATNGNVIGMNCFADGDLTTVSNYLDVHNSVIGERASRMYNDAAGSKVVPNGVVKKGVSLFSVYDNYNIKTDTFNNNGAGSVGTWAYSHHVGCVGNVSLFGSVSRSASEVPGGNGFGYLGDAWQPGEEYNLFRTALGYTQANIMDMFANHTAAPRAVPARGGNYQPLSTATQLKNRVPAGLSVLAYDIAGNARMSDGTGAAGAYEAAP